MYLASFVEWSGSTAVECMIVEVDFIVMNEGVE
jgi:hypothetical protein